MDILFFQNLRKSQKLIPHQFSLPNLVSISISVHHKEDIINNNILAVNERKSEQESNKIYKKNVNLVAFYQHLTVVNCLVFN